MHQREAGIGTIWIIVAVFAVVGIGAAGYFVYQSATSNRTANQATPPAAPSRTASASRLTFASRAYGFKVALPRTTWAGYKTYVSQQTAAGENVTKVGFFLPYPTTPANQTYQAEVAGYAEIFHVLIIKKPYYATLSAQDKAAIDGKTLLSTADRIYASYYTGQTLPTFAVPFTTAKAEAEKVLKTFTKY